MYVCTCIAIGDPIIKREDWDLIIRLNLKQLDIKRPRHIALEIQDLAWDRHKTVVGLNRLIGSQSSPFELLHNYKRFNSSQLSVIKIHIPPVQCLIL
jgi:hypothetical protein